MAEMFLDDERSDRLRTGILNDYVSGLLNDVERANFLGLPPTTRIRERAKIISPENLVSATTAGSARTPSWTRAVASRSESTPVSV